MHKFETERLVMRLLDEQDKKLYCFLYTDPRTMRQIGEPLSPEQAEKAFRVTLCSMASGSKKILSWVIIDKQTLQPIGIQGFNEEKSEVNTFNIGIMLTRLANGKLIPEEALTGLIQFGFSSLNIERIKTEFGQTHKASARITKKLGFIFNKTLPEAQKTGYIAKTDWIQKQHKNPAIQAFH